MRMRVYADYQGQGFGQLILSELETRARAKGYTTLHLRTSTVQITAQKLYEKHHQLQIILYEKGLG